MKIKVVNHKKFRRGLILLLVIIFCIIFNLKNCVSSESIVNYKTISVTNGDTLWSIAQHEQAENSYYQNYEIRKIVADIKQINNLDSCDLAVHQNLKIPTYNHDSYNM